MKIPGGPLTAIKLRNFCPRDPDRRRVRDRQFFAHAHGQGQGHGLNLMAEGYKEYCKDQIKVSKAKALDFKEAL